MLELRHRRCYSNMSPPVRYRTEVIRELLLRERIVTMEQLKQALGTNADLTVFRKLKELSCHTSYSHRGRYYTLDEITRFDEWGLWSFNSVWFSKHGTLMRTAEVLVENSEAGYYASELEIILNVSVKDTLRKLFEQKRLYRQQVQNRLLYLSTDPHRCKQQLLAREFAEEDSGDGEVFPEELKAAIILFFSLLDERQRRLYAGLEALKWGHGGDRRLARLLGLDEKTVARGRRELLDQEVDYKRIRKRGGGRKPLKKGLQK